MKESPSLHATSLHHVTVRKLTVFAMVVSFSLVGSVSAMDVTLQWDANTEPNLAGYRIYYDTDSGHPYVGYGALEGNSPIEIDLLDDENPDPGVVEYTLHDLSDGTWYFAVTAFNNENPSLESGYSNEVSTSAAVDTSPPYTMNYSPVPGATGVPIDTLISLEIRDPGVGVDLYTIALRVNGSQVAPFISGNSARYILSYDPNENFAENESVSVEVEASDLNGNVMTTVSFIFTTGSSTPPPDNGGGGSTVPIDGNDTSDTSPPYMMNHSPVPGATGVLVNTLIIFEVRDKGTGVDRSTIRMWVNGSEVSPSVKWYWGGYKVTYDPVSDFNHGESVSVKVEASDWDGNAMDPESYTFTTEPAQDTSPPYTTNHDPVPGATGVSTDTLIVLEIVDPGGGVDLSSITMWVNGSEVSPSISGDPESYTLSYDPGVEFSFDESVSIEIDASDGNGNAMDPYFYTFTTEPAQDTSPPYTANHDPVPGATGVSTDTLIVLEIVDSGVGVDLSSITMWVNGSEVSPSISGGPECYTLSYDPGVEFSFDESVSVEIDASDLDGNKMVADFYTFTITEPEPPSKGTTYTSYGGGGGCFISTLKFR